MRTCPLLLAAALSLYDAAQAQGAAEEIGSWRLACTGTAQIRFDRNLLIEMPCNLEGRSLVCAPRPADAARAAADLLGAERALLRMTGMGSPPPSEPAELRVAETRAATERLRRAQPAGTAPPPPPPGVDPRELLGRVQRFFP